MDVPQLTALISVLMFLFACFAGAFGSLLGIGGSIIIVPVLHLVFKVSMNPVILDISKLTGFNTWLVAIYNHHKWLYGLLGLILVGIVALISSFLTDWIMDKLGYKSERMEHRE